MRYFTRDDNALAAARAETAIDALDALGCLLCCVDDQAWASIQRPSPRRLAALLFAISDRLGAPELIEE